MFYVGGQNLDTDRNIFMAGSEQGSHGDYACMDSSPSVPQRQTSFLVCGNTFGNSVPQHNMSDHEQSSVVLESICQI